MRTLAAGALAALVLAAGAHAGGFATVGVAPLPSGDAVWTPTLTVRAHGVTPVDGLRPVVTIRNARTGHTRSFPARPAGGPGRYAVRVEFPAPGTWVYEVEDGYAGRTHTFKPVEIAAAGAPLSLPWTIGGTAALAAALAVLVLVGGRVRTAAAPVAAAGTR